MDENALKERIRSAIQAEIPSFANRGSWFADLALHVDASPEMLQAYVAGKHKMPAHILLQLFRHFGPDFEARVRGVRRGVGDTQLRAFIAELENVCADARKMLDGPEDDAESEA